MTEDIDREMGELQARLTVLRRVRYSADRAERRKQREQSPRIQAIKKWYLANEISVAEIARTFNTSAGAISALVIKYDWPRRSRIAQAGQRRRYREREASDAGVTRAGSEAPAERVV